MSVGIYSSPDPTTVLSQNGQFTKPFAVTFDGRIGGYKEIKLFLRNDDPTRYYTNLVLSLEDLEGAPVTSRPEVGFAWKLSYGDTKPTFNDWNNTPAANMLTISDTIGAVGNPDTSTYLPFWVFIQTPAHLDAQVFTGVKFVVEGNEALV